MKIRNRLRNFRERARRWGRTNRDVVTLVGVLVVVAFLAGTCGCGGSALAIHARALTIATVATQGGEEMAVGMAAAEIDACTDVPCVEAVELRYAPVSFASAALRTALTGWDAALSVAAVADANGDVLAALLVALARFVSRWDSLASALMALGHELPSLPGFVRDMARSLGGE